jgi:excisionase family DNA binding protein
MGMTEEERRLLKGNAAFRSASSVALPDEPLIERLAVKPAVAAAMLGTSRSSVYRLINSGQLYAVKSGASTLVLVDSIRKYLASLPRLGGAPRQQSNDAACGLHGPQETGAGGRRIAVAVCFTPFRFSVPAGRSAHDSSFPEGRNTCLMRRTPSLNG